MISGGGNRDRDLPDTNAIMFIPAEGAYVVYAESEVDDTQGNGNGAIDYGESIWLNVGLENVGAAAAEGVEATLSSENPWVTLTDNTETYGDRQLIARLRIHP